MNSSTNLTGKIYLHVIICCVSLCQVCCWRWGYNRTYYKLRLNQQDSVFNMKVYNIPTYPETVKKNPPFTTLTLPTASVAVSEWPNRQVRNGSCIVSEVCFRIWIHYDDNSCIQGLWSLTLHSSKAAAFWK